MQNANRVKTHVFFRPLDNSPFKRHWRKPIQRSHFYSSFVPRKRTIIYLILYMRKTPLSRPQNHNHLNCQKRKFWAKSPRWKHKNIFKNPKKFLDLLFLPCYNKYSSEQIAKKVEFFRLFSVSLSECRRFLKKKWYFPSYFSSFSFLFFVQFASSLPSTSSSKIWCFWRRR